MGVVGSERASAARQLLGLDLIRFLAAASVMMFHLSYWSWAKPGSEAARIAGSVSFPEMEPFTWFGWIGVQVFFVVSGFVIALTANGSSPLDFIRRRMTRLYPAAWICATCSAAVWLALGLQDVRHLWIPYAHSMVLFPQTPWIDGVYWTLSVEISFYVLITALLCANLFRHATVVAGVLGAYSTAYWVVQHALGLQWHAQQLFKLSLAPHGCEFALGMLLWLITARGASFTRLALAALCLGGGVLQIMGEVAIKAAETGRTNSPLPPIVAWLSMVALIAASSIWGGEIFSRFGRSARVIRLIGLMTYPLYLLHDVFGSAMLRGLLAVHFGPGTSLTLAAVGTVVLSFGVAAGLEPIIQRRLKPLLGRIAGLIAQMTAFRFLVRLTQPA